MDDRQRIVGINGIRMLILVALAIVPAACGDPNTAIKPPEVTAEPLADLQGTEWVLTSLNGNSPVEDTIITLAFFPDDYLQGEVSCNSFGADYVISGSNFHLAEIHRTSFDCDVPDSVSEQEMIYFQALADVAAYRVTADYLEFDNAAGDTILTLTRKLPPSVDTALKDTEWILTLLHGEKLIEGSRITLNLAQEGFGGFAGCNRYGGEYDEADEGVLNISEVWQTEMDCQPSALVDQEQVYVEALTNAAAYLVTQDRLEIDDAAGETTLVFVRKEEAVMTPDGLLDTAWQLVSLNGESLIEGAPITLAFHSDYRASGHAGCRDYVATYAASGDDMSFSFFAMIEAGCSREEALMAQEGVYTTLLGWASGYRLQERQLEILTERGEVLVFEPLPPDDAASLVGTSWALAAFIEEEDTEEMATPLPRLAEPLIESQITATFENGIMSGSAGCNTYTAPYTAGDSSFIVETVAITEMACPDPPGVMEQEQRYLDFLRSVATYRIHYNQLWLETGNRRALVFTVQVGGKDCSIENAFPSEEAELILPTLRQVQPARAAPGDQVEVRGNGGFLYWNNECGEFQNESARDFQLLFDGEPVGTITCYAYTCLTDLTIPDNAAPGVHTISVEGGSSLDIEVGGELEPSQSEGVLDLELIGYLGSAQARAVAVRDGYAYVGIDIELAVVEISDPDRAQRVGFVVLPGPVMDMALVGNYVYTITGNGAGLYIVDVAEPTAPTVRSNYYTGLYFSAIGASGGYVYVSGNVLHILDVSDPAAPLEVGAHSFAQGTPGERVEAVVIGEPQAYTYAYMTYNNTRSYGFRIVDVSDPTEPVVIGSLAMDGPPHEVAIVGDYAYLLVGSRPGRLVIVDISDPQKPAEVNPSGARPWASESLAVRNHYLYLAGYDLRQPEPVGGLQVLDITNPANPMALGRYEGMPPEVLDIQVEGARAYIAAGDGLAVLDVSDPTAPTDAGYYHANALPGNGLDLAVEGSTVYVAAGEAGLLVVDASDPVKPKVVSSLDTAGHAWAIALAQGDPQGHTYAYVADEYNGLRIIDLSDPLAPIEVGAYDLPGQVEFFHGVAVLADNAPDLAYAYVADGGLLDTGLRIIDVSDPAHPFEVAYLPLTVGSNDTPPSRVEDVAVAGSYAYLAAGTAGLRVIDISNPEAPVEIGFHDTPGRTDNLVVMGQYAYIADGDLRIVDVSNPAVPAHVGFYDVPDPAWTPYVAVQGRYAYITGNGIRILNISVPGAPVEVARHPIPVGSVTVTGDTVYVASSGLFILNTN